MPSDLFLCPPHKLADNVHHLGKVDISAIKKLLAQKTPENWQENEMRQKQFLVHRDTESIVLKWSENSSSQSPVETAHYFYEFEPLLQPIFDLIQNQYRYDRPVWRKIMFAKLKVHGEITPHVDTAIALQLVHRIHIPIVTNEHVHFFINGVDYNLHVGEVVSVDNTRMHSVQNHGEEDRIHLIVDYYHL